MGDFATRFLEFREYTKLGQVDFAVKCGLNQGNISQWENGHNKPSGPKLKKIEKAFPELNTDWLFTGEGSMLISQSKRTLDDVDWKSKYYEALEELSSVWKEIANLRKGESTDGAPKQ